MYNSIYLVSHSICNYERLTEEGKGPLPKVSLKARKTFISAYHFFRISTMFVQISLIFMYL